jgi:hypothetical protein
VDGPALGDPRRESPETLAPPRHEDTAWNRLLHNETAFIIQRRLQHVGVPMVVLPVQLNLSAVGTGGTVRRPVTELAA